MSPPTGSAPAVAASFTAPLDAAQRHAEPHPFATGLGGLPCFAPGVSDARPSSAGDARSPLSGSGPRPNDFFFPLPAEVGTGARSATAPILDRKCQNVPPEGKRPWRMGRKHYRARSRVRDSMRLWQRERRVQWWMTFTSSPQSPQDRLRRDFQAWRKRLARHLGVEPAEVAYVMVDTREGHGVLHAVVAFPPGVGAWLEFGALGDWWQEIHGARQVKFKRIGKGDGDVRRLSTYLIAQYMVAQGETVDLLGRISSTRAPFALGSLRRQVFRMCTPRGEVYRAMHAGNYEGPIFDEVWRFLRVEQFKRARRCWDQLLTHGWFAAADTTWALVGGQLMEV